MWENYKEPSNRKLRSGFEIFAWKVISLSFPMVKDRGRQLDLQTHST